MLRLGVVSDTHGLLRPQVLEKLEGCQRILHAGDVGEQKILDQLAQLAPVEAVRGNTDSGSLMGLPETLEGRVEELDFYMVHRRQDVDPRRARGAGLVIFGHSHRPELEWRGQSMWLNPGAAGPRRFSLPLTLAVLTIDGKRVIPEIISLETPAITKTAP